MELFGIPVQINPQCQHSIWALTREGREADEDNKRTGKQYTHFWPDDLDLCQQLQAAKPIRLEMSQELYDRAKGVEGG